jgi:superfamily II DNA or RNA helicase
MTPLHLKFDAGTVVITGGTAEQRSQLPGVCFDSRTQSDRAEARFYRAIVEAIRVQKWPYQDEARNYQPVEWKLESDRDPYPHQTEAVETWWKQRACGVVVLPTGTGKTFVAMLAIAKAGRPTLVLTPTIDLLNQWHWQLAQSFGDPIGLIGGGHHDVHPITVTTYDSAYIHFDRLGNRFGLLVFDECHHLPGASYSEAARGSIAPFRLGLTATPERADGQEMRYPELIGPIVYRREIKELSGDFLAEYRTEKVFVSLSKEEQERYLNARMKYRQFISDSGISLSSPSGWQRFIFETTRSPEGWEAMRAYRETKRLERASPAKLQKLEELLQKHQGDRVIVFTADNATVYQIARRFLVPPITHQTKARERKQILERFHSGEYNVVVTSQVLNEGVDVPAANVGIVLSGTSTIRESVQRLGRLLRKQKDKQAILYEVVARDTAEEFSSERRRQHKAFQ